MVDTKRVEPPPPRPASNVLCTCLIQDIQRTRRYNETARLKLNVINLMDHIPGGLPQLSLKEQLKDMDQWQKGESSPEHPPNIHEESQNGCEKYNNTAEQRRAKCKAIGNSGLANVHQRDVLSRQIKKRFAQSSENKIRELVSYKEDLAVILNVIQLFPSAFLCLSYIDFSAS